MTAWAMVPISPAELVQLAAMLRILANCSAMLVLQVNSRPIVADFSGTRRTPGICHSAYIHMASSSGIVSRGRQVATHVLQVLSVVAMHRIAVSAQRATSVP